MIGKTKLLILQLLQRKSSYGYKIAKETQKTAAGIYVHLYDLESHGLIESNIDSEKRKYYSITEKGLKFLNLINER